MGIELRKIAEEFADQERRKLLLTVAEEYEQMAHSAEGRTQ